jgi:chitin disaccharide deacetylase
MNALQVSETNRLLGYPRDARLLILNADDFGLCHATNAAIWRSLRDGVVCSTTLMVPCPWAPHAMHLLEANPDVPFGVHLTVIGDGYDYRWRPLTPVDRVPSLIDDTGYFYCFERMTEFFSKAKLDELELEFRTQIETVLTAGLVPSHLDWHALRIERRPEIFDVMFTLAREYGLALRVRGRELIDKVRGRGLPAIDYDFLDSYLLDSRRKSDWFAQLLRELPVGLNEWAVHPGWESDELRAIEGDGAGVRQADFDFLLSQEARKVIRQEGITLLSYKPLQEVWQRVEAK